VRRSFLGPLSSVAVPSRSRKFPFTGPTCGGAGGTAQGVIHNRAPRMRDEMVSIDSVLTPGHSVLLKTEKKIYQVHLDGNVFCDVFKSEQEALETSYVGLT
jgi:hypothetical protein